LPVLAKVVEFDREAQDLTKGWNATFQFGYLGGPTVQLQFADGNCRVFRQAAVTPDVHFWFPLPVLLNNMLTGKGLTLPLINGFWNVKLLKGFMALAKRMEYYLKDLEGQTLDDDLTRKVLTLKLSLATWGTAVLAECDPHVATLAGHIPGGGSLNFVIKPDGPNYYFKKANNGAYLAGDGSVAEPSAEVTFADMHVAADLVNGQLDTMAAVGKQDLVIRGLIPMVDDVSAIMAKLESYLK
jgi:hypothetical protein